MFGTPTAREETRHNLTSHPVEHWMSGWGAPDEAAWDAAEAAATRLPDDGQEVLPAGLENWAPGPVVAAVLSSVSLEALSEEDGVVALQACHRLVAHTQAREYAAIASVAAAYRRLLAESPDQPADEEWVWRATEAELRAALRLTRRAAAAELGLAEDVRTRLPRVARALATGSIDRQRARILVTDTCHLPEATARRVVDEILDAGTLLTTGQLRRQIRLLAVQIEPDQAEQRFRHTNAERRMVVEPTCDGTAHLIVMDVSPERAVAASDHVNRLARHLGSRPGETRTLDQLRADVAVDLLSGRRADSVTRGRGDAGGRVELQVDLATLARLSETPGRLAGYGPVIADIARQVAVAARSWDYTVTDPDTGDVLHSGTTRRRPGAASTRAVRARHAHCLFPGCLMPARHCDLDHRHPYSEGGPTNRRNLGPVCRYDHVNRHRLGWTYAATPDGDHLWTSPLGPTYTTSGRPP